MGKVFDALNKAMDSNGLKSSNDADDTSSGQVVSAKQESLRSESEMKPEPVVEPQIQPVLKEAEQVVEKVSVVSEKIPVQSFLDINDEKEVSIDDWDERLVEVISNSPLVTEGIRRLRSKILHPVDNKPIRSVLVTSATPGEGKSFICANLGVSMAQGIEKHALMVDCDLRRPTMAKLFGVSNDTGLINYLSSGEDLHRLIKKTGQAKLSLLPSGPPPVNPSELLDSSKMVSMIDELSERYSDRLIFLDSPPHQAAAETAVLAKHVDGVVVVVRWGHSSRELIKELVETIGKEKIIGVVFNAFHTNAIENRLQKIKGYGGYYQYGSGY